MDYQFLHLLNFSDLKNWSVQFLLGIQSSYNDNYPLVPLGNFLIRNKKPVEIQDDKEYKRVTIKINNGGVFLRDIEIGKNIGTKNQFEIKESQFILSKIDARNGAFGIANSNVDGAIITGNFWAYDVDYSKIDPIYLSLITTTNYFIKFCQKSSVGTTNRNYLQEELFLAEQIPLPDIDIQKSLVSAYQEKIRQTEILKNQAEQIDIEIEQYLFESLGIEVNQNQRKKQGVLQFVKFKDIDRWFGCDNSGIFKSSKYKTVALENNSELYCSVFRGKSPKYAKDKTSSVILNQKCNRWNEIDISFLKYVNNDWFSQIDKNLLTKIGDILINSTGEGTIGRASYIQANFTGMLYDSHLLLLRLNTNLVNSLYFVHLFNSKYGQNQINLIKSAQTTKQTELGVTNLKKIQFPLPPIEIQNQIATHIQALKTQQKQAKTQVQILREQAIAEFEQAIFI